MDLNARPQKSGHLVLLCTAILVFSCTGPQAKPPTDKEGASIFPSPSLGPTIESDDTHSLEAYIFPLSIAQGEALNLKVSSTDPAVKVEFARFGASEESVLGPIDVAGKVQVVPSPGPGYLKGAGWETSYSTQVPAEWKSGLYVAKLTNAAGKKFFVSFVIKDRSDKLSTDQILVITPTNTWHSYNKWGGGSFYSYEVPDRSGRRVTNYVHFQRPNREANPYGGLGHLTFGEKFSLAWLERENFPYTMITDSDLHADPDILERFKIVLLNTHSEYWSSPMYDGLERYLNAGGNLVNLGANNVYWKVVIQGEQMEVRKDFTKHQFIDEPGGTWRRLGRPEARLLGVQFTDEGYLTSAPFQVKKADHWAFANTNVKDGDLFAQTSLTKPGGGSGWETDKLAPESPSNIVILAKGTNKDNGGGEMSYYDHPAGGGVFSAGALTFGGSLLPDAVSSTLMKNVLNHLRAKPSVAH